MRQIKSAQLAFSANYKTVILERDFSSVGRSVTYDRSQLSASASKIQTGLSHHEKNAGTITARLTVERLKSYISLL